MRSHLATRKKSALHHNVERLSSITFMGATQM